MAFEQVRIDPIGSVPFISSERCWPNEWRLILIDRKSQFSTVEQVFERRGFVSLAGRQAKVQRQSLAVTKEMNLRGKTAA